MTQPCLNGQPIYITDRLDPAAWNALADKYHSLYHLYEWTSIWKLYGLQYYYLGAFRDHELVGILPLVHQHSLLTGNQLVSLPWFDTAGILSEDPVATHELCQAAQNLAQDLGAQTVQLRHSQPSDLSPHCRQDKVGMRLELTQDPEILWQRLPGKVRNQVRKAMKNGLTVESGGQELLHDFYRIYASNMRHLGSPSHSYAFFEAVWKTFQDRVRLYIAYQAGQALGCGFTISYGKMVVIPWGSSLKAYNSLCVNHLMYWQILSDACQQGYQHFHFGRASVDSGQYHFKAQWGATPEPLYWYFLSRDPISGARAATPPQSRWGWGAKLWRHLPATLTRHLGPHLIAHIP